MFFNSKLAKNKKREGFKYWYSVPAGASEAPTILALFSKALSRDRTFLEAVWLYTLLFFFFFFLKLLILNFISRTLSLISLKFKPKCKYKNNNYSVLNKGARLDEKIMAAY